MNIAPALVDPDKPLAVFYAIRNEKGQYWRTYDKYRSPGWKDNLEDAKLWTRIGPAKAKITALSHGKGPVPELVEFVVREVRVVDQNARIAEFRKKQEAEQVAAAEAYRREALRQAQSDYDRALARLKKVKGVSVEREHGSDCGCKSCMGM
jgi:hypothetical protein